MMLQQRDTTITQIRESLLATNKVLKNTYILLSLTLLFSAGTAAFAMATNAKPLNIFVWLIFAYGLIFLTSALSHSAWGLLATFAFTGFMGYTLGPILNHFLSAYTNGSAIVMTALGGTGLIFFALSGYVMVTRKDFSYLAGFLFIAAMVAMLAIVASLFFPIPALQLGISAAFMLIASGMILFETSQIIHGGERNYILATISLYVSIYNLFISLLQLLGSFAGNRE